MDLQTGVPLRGIGENGFDKLVEIVVSSRYQRSNGALGWWRLRHFLVGSGTSALLQLYFPHSASALQASRAPACRGVARETATGDCGSVLLDEPDEPLEGRRPQKPG